MPPYLFAHVTSFCASTHLFTSFCAYHISFECRMAWYSLSTKRLGVRTKVVYVFQLPVETYTHFFQMISLPGILLQYEEILSSDTEKKLLKNVVL